MALKGGIRCRNCGPNYIRLEIQMPELLDLSMRGDRILRAMVRIARNCTGCQKEYRHHIFQTSTTFDIPGHNESDHVWSVYPDALDPRERPKDGITNKGQSWYGYCLDYRVECSCGAGVIRTETLTDMIEAGKMIDSTLERRP